MGDRRAGPSLPASALRSPHAWVAVIVVALLLGLGTWLVVSDAPVYRFLVRLYVDKKFMHTVLRQWGVLAPLVFIVIQASQVVIAPIPGEVTGLLGGFGRNSQHFFLNLVCTSRCQESDFA